MKTASTKYLNNLQFADILTFNTALASIRNHEFIIVDSYNNNLASIENKKLFEDLKSHVSKSGFTYIPIYAGYVNQKQKSSEIFVSEPVLIIVNTQTDLSVEKRTTSDLIKFGYDIIKLFHKDSFLYTTNDNNSYFSNIGENLKIHTSMCFGLTDCIVQSYFSDFTKSKTRIELRGIYTKKHSNRSVLENNNAYQLVFNNFFFDNTINNSDVNIQEHRNSELIIELENIEVNSEVRRFFELVPQKESLSIDDSITFVNQLINEDDTISLEEFNDDISKFIDSL